MAEDEKFSLTILNKDSYKENGKYLSVPNQKVFLFMILKFSQKNNYGNTDNLNIDVKISTLDYMEAIGREVTPKNKEKTRNEIIRAAEIIYQHEVKNIEKIKGKETEVRFRMVQKLEIPKRGDISVQLGNDFAKYLNTTYRLNIPGTIFKIDGRQDNAFHIARKLLEQSGITANIKNRNNDIISIKSLLQACPEIPSYEEVASGDRHFTRKIIDPLEKALNHLTDIDVLSSWHFCNAKSEELNKKQLDLMNYESLGDSYIKFTLCYLDQKLINK